MLRNDYELVTVDVQIESSKLSLLKHNNFFIFNKLLHFLEKKKPDLLRSDSLKFVPTVAHHITMVTVITFTIILTVCLRCHFNCSSYQGHFRSRL
jgi:hypothetical protein